MTNHSQLKSFVNPLIKEHGFDTFGIDYFKASNFLPDRYVLTVRRGESFQVVSFGFKGAEAVTFDQALRLALKRMNRKTREAS